MYNDGFGKSMLRLTRRMPRVYIIQRRCLPMGNIDVKEEWRKLNVFLKVAFILVAMYIGTDLASFIYGVGQDLGDAIYCNILN